MALSAVRIALVAGSALFALLIGATGIAVASPPGPAPCHLGNDPYSSFQDCLSNADDVYDEDVAEAKARNASQVGTCKSSYDRYEDLDEFNSCIADVRSDFDSDMASAKSNMAANKQACENLYEEWLKQEGQ